MDDIKLYFWIAITIVSVIAGVISKAKKNEAQAKNFPKIEEEEENINNIQPIKARKKLSSNFPTSEVPMTETPKEEEKETREYSEKEKMIIYSEIMKPKFED